MKKQAVVLFAHGSRDPEWAEPFERLASTLRKLIEGPVAIAYLERMKPTLGEAIDMLAKQAGAIRVVPVFLGPGGHVKEDLPRMVDEARVRNPSTQIIVDAPIGDQAAIIEALANAIAMGR